MYIGAIGAFLIALSWIPQLFDLLKGKVDTVSIKFSVIYILGSLLLVIYSINISDYIFLFLNSLALLFSAMNFFVAMKKGKLI